MKPQNILKLSKNKFTLTLSKMEVSEDLKLMADFPDVPTVIFAAFDTKPAANNHAKKIMKEFDLKKHANRIVNYDSQLILEKNY